MAKDQGINQVDVVVVVVVAVDVARFPFLSFPLKRC